MESPTPDVPFYTFLRQNRESILSTCKKRTLEVAEHRSLSPELELGWGIFFDEFVGLLERDSTSILPDTQQVSHEVAAAKHGKEYLRLGYSISEVVHSYGVICQAITGEAEKLEYRMTAREFRQLNLSLDVAIAEAVTSFEQLQSSNARDNEVERLGFLTHELRSSLHAATMALAVIKDGTVGLQSQTGGVLERSLTRMRDLVEATVTEVRSRRQNVVHLRRLNLAQLIREVVDHSMLLADEKKIALIVSMDADLDVDSDRQLLVTALQNLVQNAIKFSHPESTVSIRASLAETHIEVEIEDRCGGLKTAKLEQLFAPFSQYNSDRTGLGLGLAISRRAAELNGGRLEVENLVGKGCIFRLILPRPVAETTSDIEMQGALLP